MNKIYFLIFFVFVSCGLFAQNLNDTIINIANISILSQKIYKKEDAGMKETKIDTLVLAEQANLSLSELLSENTPVFVKSHGRGALATVSFRGTAASHTQVMWNGININSPMTGMVDFSLIPVSVVDNISLKHGAASLKDQSGALGGSINIQNTVDWDDKFSAKYRQGIGSYSTFDEFLQIGGGSNKLKFKTRLYHNKSDNDYTYINRGIVDIDYNTGKTTNPLDTNNLANYKKYGFLQEAYYKLNIHNIFSIKYWGQWSDRTIPRATSFEGPDNSNLNNQTDNNQIVVANWKHITEKSKLNLRCGYLEKSLHYTLRNHVSGLGLIPAIYSRSKSKSYMNTVSYSYNIDDDFSIESKLDINYYDVHSKDSVKKTGYDENESRMSFLLAAHKNFSDRLNINVMIRQDRIDDNFSPLMPFLGFDFRIFEEFDFLLKGNIARNYHYPSLNDKYWQPGGNTALLPEDGIGGELGLEYQTDFDNHNLKTEITYYRSDIDNWIIWIPSFKGYWEPRNIKRVLAQGIEFCATFSGSFGKFNYKALLNYAYSPTINYGDPLMWGDESYGKQLVYVPLHSANVLLNLSYKGYALTYQYNAYDERYTTSSNDISRRDWLYPYYMSNISLKKKFNLEKLDLTGKFNLYNIFNETYHSILYRPMPRINYSFSFMISI